MTASLDGNGSRGRTNRYSLESDAVLVRGRVVHPATRHEFRERRLFDGGGRELVATVVVDGEGNVTVNE